MADRNPGGKGDRKLISLMQEHELDSWCRTFGCSRDQLRAAVAAVGNSAKAVRAYLESQKPAPDQQPEQPAPEQPAPEQPAQPAETMPATVPLQPGDGNNATPTDEKPADPVS